MKTRHFRILLFSVCCTLGLSSCLVNHQRLCEQAVTYDGIWMKDGDTIYRLNGKNYRQGVRTQFSYQRKNSYIDFKEAIIGPSMWDWKKVDGTEGEIVYREVDQEGYLKEDSPWVSMDMCKATTKKDEYYFRTYMVDNKSRNLTPHAFYALPAAALCLIPDVVGSVAVWTVYGTGMVIQGIVLLPVSQQQQQMEPVVPPPPKPVME